MGIFVLTVCAFIGGAIPVILYYQSKRILFERQVGKLAEQVTEHNNRVASYKESLASHQLNINNLQAAKSQLNEKVQAFANQTLEFQSKVDAFSKQKISYQELLNENKLLKADLKNNGIMVAKERYENVDWGRKQELVSAKCEVLGRRFLKDTIKWVSSSLTQHNFSASKQRLTDAIGWCREIGLDVSSIEEEQMLANLKAEYEMVVRAAFEREEQMRIRAQIREEQEHEREVQKAIEDADRERRAVEAALVRLKAQANDQHAEEIKKLEAQLAEAIAKSQRAISQAQITKSGNVYIISNIGSFGTGVYKIGMTRRLEPLDRVRELGSASVPFPYDVHAMIATNNAPALENALHRAFHRHRINKANPRKEFFRVNFEDILTVVKKQHGEIVYKADAEALQYMQSVNMKAEDQEFIENTFDKFETDADAFVEDE